MTLFSWRFICVYNTIIIFFPFKYFLKLYSNSTQVWHLLCPIYLWEEELYLLSGKRLLSWLTSTSPGMFPSIIRGGQCQASYFKIPAAQRQLGKQCYVLEFILDVNSDPYVGLSVSFGAKTCADIGMFSSVVSWVVVCPREAFEHSCGAPGKRILGPSPPP